MTFSVAARRRLHWFNLPGALLLALLQRTPALRVAATAAESLFASSPVSAVLKAAATTLGALGAVHSMAGATTLSASTPSPAALRVGTAATIVFSVTGAQSQALSWTVANTPPGLGFTAFPNTGTGVTSGIVNTNGAQLLLSGTPTTAGQFVVSLRAWEGANGTATNSTFSYTINVAAAANSAPSITTQPASATVPAGGTVVLTAAAAGSPTPTLQWFRGTTPLSGQTASTLVISGATATDAGSYVLVASNSLGSATSNAAVITVNGVIVSPPVFTTSPASVTVAAGGSAVFTAAAANSPAYQWRKNGVAVPGATSATLSLTGLATTDTGNYDVVATNSAGAATSAAANLIVTGPLSSRLSNLSVRTTLAANQILIVGLTVAGGGGRDILLRAAGPALGALGVAGTMADPKLTLFNGSAVEAANDNWGAPTANAATVTAANAAVGAFAFASTASLDAALVATSVSGGRTVQVSGPAAGNLIVEAYDTGSTNTPRLTNLSALNQVGTGGDVLIAGFTVAGSGSKNLLIRAVGPTLAAAPFNLGGTLADPKLTVRRSSDQVIVAENDTYAASLSTVFASVGAFALTAGSKDAALILSLPASAAGTGYTVTVSGADGGTGNAIIEVYELP